jgi:hypothetical protein
MCPAQASRGPLAWYKPRVKSVFARAVRRPRWGSLLILASGLIMPLTLSGCGRAIGDECQLATDCSPNGDRTCDLSQPGGYCTIEGCDETSCPSDSACVRFFPVQYLVSPCDPLCEDTDPGSTGMLACSAGGPTTPTQCPRVTSNDCSADEVCLAVPVTDGSTDPKAGGKCAPRSSERRLCVKTCGGNGDCRGGYSCRQGGDNGSLPVLTNSCGNVSFCAPLGT